MRTTKAYDYLNRLTSISSSSSSSFSSSFNYAYNSANQRTSVTNADNSRWIYGYDSLGQVTSGKKYWNDGTLVAGQQFEYTARIPEFQEALASKLLVKFYPGPHCEQFW